MTRPNRDPHSAPDRAALHEVAPGVFAWVQPDGSWWINNAGAVLDGDSLLVIDTCATVERTTRFLEALDDAVDGVAVTLAVNTHQHGDHTYGNCLLPAEATLVGHARMREGLAADTLIDGCPPLWSPVPDWGPVTRRLPDITLAEGDIHVGDRRVRLRHPGGAAHTTGDLVAWLPDDGVLFTGDLVFAGLTPLVFMGSIPGASAAIDWLAEMEPTTVVPGHGPVLTGDDIARVFDEHRRYYRLVEEAGEAGIAAGRSPLDVARTTDLGEFSEWADSERLVLNLHRVHADAAGEDLDLVGAMADAVAYLGHPMHTSV